MTAERQDILEHMTAFTENKSFDFTGPDEFSPVVNRFSGPRGKGFFVEYDDDQSGTLVSIKYQEGETFTKVSVLNDQMDAEELERSAKLIGTASRFATALRQQYLALAR